jgi:transcriptional regulator with XRE-family HTH domain
MRDARNALGQFLRSARERRGLSLRSVEEASTVSNAYLSQLEHGRIRQPSPVILHKLSKLYEVPYTEALRLAGYPVPESSRTEGNDATRRPLSRFGDVTPDEERALAEYLEFLRTRRRSGSQ